MVANLDEISQKTNAGSPAYASPQIRDNKGYSSKCDIWSLGVLLFELMYFKLPFTIKTSN
jgi:serine/threonine protein kinase